jgi:hypothetical protein
MIWVMNVSSLSSIDLEIEQVIKTSRAMLAEYVAWGDRIVVGDAQQWMYNEVIDFVNFRMETAHTCIQLIEAGKLAESLGLCRSILEHYLLLVLMCRGRKYFRLESCTNLTDSQFKAHLKRREEELRAEHEAGNDAKLEVRKYPRASKHVMHVFEGLTDQTDPDFAVPAHYFFFQDFRPEAMRLKQDDYFEYIEPPADTKGIVKQHQQDATAIYQHYLSYGALLTCLELNDLADDATVKRIEAHYTFLGRFLHPTHNAARDLHEYSNHYSGKPAIGMLEPYTKTATLLASLYVCYLCAGLLDEITALHENAPSKFIRDAGTQELRDLIDRIPLRYSYFWFLFNDPPLYDKFNYCVSHVDETELAGLGHYSKLPSERVPFEMHIHEQLRRALTGWSNSKCGNYVPPPLGASV